MELSGAKQAGLLLIRSADTCMEGSRAPALSRERTGPLGFVLVHNPLEVSFC